MKAFNFFSRAVKTDPVSTGNHSGAPQRGKEKSGTFRTQKYYFSTSDLLLSRICLYITCAKAYVWMLGGSHGAASRLHFVGSGD